MCEINAATSSGMASNGNINVYESCWHIDVSNGTSELESGVVPRYLIINRGLPFVRGTFEPSEDALLFSIDIDSGRTSTSMDLQAILDSKAVFPEPPAPYKT